MINLGETRNQFITITFHTCDCESHIREAIQHRQYKLPVDAYVLFWILKFREVEKEKGTDR